MSHLPALPQRLHHYAFVVLDHEANRHFFEDVLGLPLVATWCERTFNSEVQREVDYCHTFYGLADGSALAFFQFADAEVYERSKVDRKTFDAIDGRLAAAGVPRRQTDHGYCVSLYATSPDGLRVEFTVDPANVEDINAVRRADAHAELKRWLAGDHAVNNLERAH
jgi:catechol 2,3-dioxygenase-like lactoylglutathione lyase family enzyme